MKIKDIRHYRTEYKEKIRNTSDSNRNEHFAGTKTKLIDGKKEYGWFDIYHGDKEGSGNISDGIRNFLESFLEMAKDGQAVYEFLQNAVDVGSSHFAMFWGKDEIDGNDYLMVANNGGCFSFENLRSILNVGSSTKSSDDGKIGKFGIGFKLAHRLVGKDNGLDELINNNYGPLLYSWGNDEVNKLTKNSLPELVKDNIIEVEDDKFEFQKSYPLFFKILVTCFPVNPINDTIKNVEGVETSNPFSKEEYDAFLRWVLKYQNILQDDNYQSGSIFFIRLGEGKIDQLIDENLKEGVRFSLAVLNETSNENTTNKIQKIQLGDKESIDLPKLNYLNLTIPKNHDDYAYIRFGVDSIDELTKQQISEQEKEADIEILFGFRNYAEIENYFQGAPNFYLYFPLGEEVHNFNYILHCNAFYKSSSRTYLHQGTASVKGRNERLFEKIVERIELKFEDLTESESEEDTTLFLNLYASFLTSGISTNNERNWVKEPFIYPIDNLLKEYIPVLNKEDRFGIVDDSNTVYWKCTDIDIDLDGWGILDINWFYLSNNDFKSKALYKLGIKEYKIVDLLENKNIYVRINKWLDNDSEKIKTVLKELNQSINNTNSDTFKANVKELKIFEFSNKLVCSLNDLESTDDNKIILYKDLSEIKDLLLKLGFVVTTVDFDNYQNFTNLQWIRNDFQLRKRAKVIEIFSSFIDNQKLSVLSKEDKLKIFNVFKDRITSGNMTNEIKELRLFRNQLGELKPLKEIIRKAEHNWLKNFELHQDDSEKELNKYLITEDSDIYELIIQPYYPTVLNEISKLQSKQTESFDKIIEFFESDYRFHKENEFLKSENAFLFNKEVCIPQSKNWGFYDKLNIISNEGYNSIQALLQQKFDYLIPDKFQLEYITDEPWNYISNAFNLEEDIILTFEELSILNDLDTSCGLNLFNGKVISTIGANFTISTNEAIYQYHTDDEFLKKYIETYHPELQEVDRKLVSLNISSVFNKQNIITYLIDNFKSNDYNDCYEVILAFTNQSKSDNEKLLEKISFLPLHLESKAELKNKNEIVLKFIGFIFEIEELDNISNKIVFFDNEIDFKLKDHTSSSSEIRIKKGEKEFYHLSQSALLSQENEELFIKLKTTIDELRVSRIFSHYGSFNKLFKVESSSNKKLINDVVNNLENEYYTQNAHQLAFILLSDNLPNGIGHYEVIVSENEEENNNVELRQSFYIQNDLTSKFIKPAFLLDEKYNNILEILKSDNFEYDSENSFYIADHLPLSDSFNINHLSESLTEEDIYDYLFEKSNEGKEYIGWDLQEINTLKFKGEEYLIKSEFEDERVPSDFKYHVNIKFLKRIGVDKFENSIKKLRTILCKEEHNYGNDCQIDFFDKIPIKFLANTLKLIFNSNICFDYGSEEWNLCKSIFKKVIDFYDEKSELEWNLLPQIVEINKVKFYKQIDNKTPFGFKNQEDFDFVSSFTTKINEFFNNYFVVPNDLSDYLVCEKLEVSKDWVDTQFSEELTGTYYQTLREEYDDVRIFKLNDHCEYKLSVNDFYITNINEGGWHIEYVEAERHLFFCPFEHTLTQLSNIIDEGYVEQALNEMNESIEVKNQQIANLIADGGLDYLTEEGKEIIDKTKKEIEQKQSREKHEKELKEQNEYSYDWFVSYLDYLLTFTQKSNEQQEKAIGFSTVKKYKIKQKINNRYCLLCGASKVIPSYIEDFSDFRITFSFKNNRLPIMKEVEGVSIKGQNLLALSPKGFDDIFEYEEDIIGAKISFTPLIDLLQRLRDEFVKLDSWEDLYDFPSLEYIYGPPGTGKTTTLCKFIKQEVDKNSNLKVLLLTPTNKASDVLVKRLYSDYNFQQSIRLSSVTDAELNELENTIYQASINKKMLDYCNLLATTVHRLPYTKLYDESSDEFPTLFNLELDYWDFIIFDEASMIGAHYISFALMAFEKQKNTRFIVAGDPKQIPPVVDVNDSLLEEMDKSEINIYKMMNISDLIYAKNNIRKTDNIKILEKQYRSVPSIGNLFSNYNYNGKLKHDRIENKSVDLPHSFNFLNKSINFINIPLEDESEVDSVIGIGKLFSSSYHIYSSILVTELLKRLDNDIDKTLKVGVVAPYKAQAVLTAKLIDSSKLKNLEVLCDTVHGFQGDERELIIFIVNPSNKKYIHPNSLLNKEYIYNVAISRAKDYLWILQPKVISNPHINKLVKIEKEYSNDINFVDSATIEQFLFKQKNYITANSYVTGHDPINVYGLVNMGYYIKKSNNAIDIQIQEDVEYK